MTTVKVNGVELYYQRNGEGERIVFTHGAWTDARTWQAVTDRLAHRFEVVVWDRRGHGRSQGGPKPGSVREDAADLAALIEHLGIEPVHVVGNSAGGSVVLNLVTMRPDALKSAAAHEPGPLAILERSDDPRIAGLMEEDKRNMSYVLEMVAVGEHRRAAQFFIDEVAIGPGAWDASPAELRDILESNAATFEDDLRDSYDADSVDINALANTNLPLLISVGSESPILESAAARELARLLPQARLGTLGGAGHIPHRTHPHDYAALLADFITASSTASTKGGER